jgi:hydroxyacylglutathione hydrolase
VTADQPDAPSYFTYDAVLNSKARPTLDEALARELRPLSLDECLEAQREGAQLLDTRDAGEFAAAHLVGSLNIGLGGSYATWAGTLLDHQTPIVIIAGPGAERESALRLGRIGFDNVLGYLEDGLASAASRPELVEEMPRVSPERAAEQLATDPTLRTIDVRDASERQVKWIASSTHVPLQRVAEAFSDVSPDTPLIVYCAGGYRSSAAASLLRRRGFTCVAELAGGMAAWEAVGLPLATP